MGFVGVLLAGFIVVLVVAVEYLMRNHFAGLFVIAWRDLHALAVLFLGPENGTSF